MVPPAVVIANIAVGSIVNAINLCKALIDRHDVKQDVKVSCHRLKEKLISCQENADKLSNYISQYRDPEVWKDSVSEINGALRSIEARLELLSQKGARGNVFAAPRRKFRQPYDMDKKLSALIKEVDYVDLKIFSFQMHNNVHTEANATSISNTDHTAESQLQESGVDEEPRNPTASVQRATPTRLETATPDVSHQNTSPIETTTAYSLVSDFVRVCTDLVVYPSKALIALGEEALLRVQEAIVAKAIADCSDCLRLLGNKTWYFCGSTKLPAFVVKMALINQPDTARHKIIDMLFSLSRFGVLAPPAVILEFRPKNMWDATTMMDVSFVNALIFKDHFRSRNDPCAQMKAGLANDINSELKISASDMLLVLKEMRQQVFVDQGLVVVLNREQGLGWYRVLFDGVDGLEQSSGTSEFRLEYICSLEIPGGGSNSHPGVKDIMILNFLHTAVIPPEARKLRVPNGKEFSYMETSLTHEGIMSKGDQAIFSSFEDGFAYRELLEIACIRALFAGYHARCKSYVDSLVENVDERQLVVSNAGGNRHTLVRQGKEISFELIAEEFETCVMKDAKEGKHAAGCDDLYEYGRFCAQGQVWESWYDLLVPTVANEMNVNFAQAALIGKGSYTKFVAQNMCARLKDSILLCDPASDSIAVAFDGVSELSSSLKVRISELMKTSESERLRAAFFICRGAVRTRRSISTRMHDVMRIRYMGLEGIGRISAQDVTEDLDEGNLRNGVVVECMESLAMQGGYRENSGETSLFAALCSSRECEKTIVVTGVWPSLEGKFDILQHGNLYKVKLEYSSKAAIVASRHAGIYRTQGICQVPESTDPAGRFESSEEVVVVL